MAEGIGQVAEGFSQLAEDDRQHLARRALEPRPCYALYQRHKQPVHAREGGLLVRHS